MADRPGFDDERFRRMLRRLEFVVLAATRVRAGEDRDSATYGILGADLFGSALERAKCRGISGLAR